MSDSLDDLVNRMTAWVRDTLRGQLHKKGALVQISGGIDSSVTATICVRALGAQQVVGLYMPERDTDESTAGYVALLSDYLGLDTLTIDVSARLDSMGAYDALHEAVHPYLPTGNVESYQYALNVDTSAAFNLGAPLYRLRFLNRDTRESGSVPLPSNVVTRIIAANNLKQRIRMTTAYHIAESKRLAVVGASNRDEISSGFIVKHGDRACDLALLAQVTKSRIYELAEFLNIPTAIIARTPTTDTFSLEQSQTEYYFPVDADTLEYARNESVPVSVRLRELQSRFGLSEHDSNNVIRYTIAMRPSLYYVSHVYEFNPERERL